MIYASNGSTPNVGETTLSGGYAVNVLPPGRAALHGIGTALTETGISILLRESVPEKDVSAVIALRGVPTNLLLQVTDCNLITIRGESWHKHECLFVNLGDAERQRVDAALQRDPARPKPRVAEPPRNGA